MAKPLQRRRRCLPRWWSGGLLHSPLLWAGEWGACESPTPPTSLLRDWRLKKELDRSDRGRSDGMRKRTEPLKHGHAALRPPNQGPQMRRGQHPQSAASPAASAHGNLPHSCTTAPLEAPLHVTPELEVLGSNPGGVGTQCPRR